MSGKLVTIYTYVSEEEKKAFEILSKLENRSISSMLRALVVDKLKNENLLREEITEEGEIVQTVLTSSRTGGVLND